MLPIPLIIWYEAITSARPQRINEPQESMDDPEQVAAYIKAYEWGGPTSALQLHHLRELAYMIRPGDTVVDLACGPGPLLLELASIYPDTRFIGADLSPTMLDYITGEAVRLKLQNVDVLCEDVRDLPSLEDGQVDLVISTSALHHLPDEQVLHQVFVKIKSLLKEDGGFYIFDFGQLKSSKTRELCVAEVAKLAPPLTTRDYDLSLQAAYPIDLVFRMAQEVLPKPCMASASAFVDFFYFLQTGKRAQPHARVLAHISKCSNTLSTTMKVEHFMLRMLRRRQTFS
jgi:ubiquinone/menaquinone biosynthesis C-methylase UbiE